MRTFTCLIIDDEPVGRGLVKKLIQSYFPYIFIADEVGNVPDAFAKISLFRPDLIFLDIELDGGSAFDLLRKFEAIDFQVIFVSGYNQYALNAFKFNAIDYLLKPIDPDDFVKAVKKACNKLEDLRNTADLLFHLLSEVDHSGKRMKIEIHEKNKVRRIGTPEIICMEATDNYTNIYTVEGQKQIVSRPLKYFEKLIAGEADFLRISRQVIINVNHINTYTKGPICIVTLCNGAQFEVSRRKKIEMKGKFRFD